MLKMESVTDKTDKEIFYEGLENSVMDIDGGYINSDLWFCGIEPGGVIKHCDVITYLNKKENYAITDSLKADVVEKYSLNKIVIPVYLQNVYDNMNEWKFDHIIGDIVSELGNIKPNFNYENKKGNVFKLNLFPLKAREVSNWNKTHSDITGCTLKKEYYGKCIEKRFPLLRRLTEAAKPKVIVCIGKTFTDEFMLAFWGNTNWWDNEGEHKSLGDSKTPYTINSIKINIYTGDEGTPTLIVTPFFGWRNHCVNKKEHIEFIRNLILKELNSKLKPSNSMNLKELLNS